VAGGMLAASAISSMLSHSPGPFGEAAAGEAASGAAASGAAADPAQSFGQENPDVHNVNYQPDDGGFDGGGDDESWI